MTKIKNLSLLMLVALCAALTSCDKNDNDDSTVTLYLNSTAIPYNAENVWTQYMNNDAKLTSQDIVFSHSANPEWNMWNGFVASRINDVTDYSDGNWLDHQFNAITKGGMSGDSTPYLVAYWNSSEPENVDFSTASCSVVYGDGSHTFIPQSIHVTNTTYTYYTLINGSAYSKKFAKGDYLKLLAYGVKEDGTVTVPVECDLADYTDDNSKPVNEWKYFNLEGLGEVKGIYFQMKSSDVGTWGINTPTYFAADRLVIKVVK